MRYVLAFVAAGVVAGGCGSLEKSAAKDPLKCERDPDCSNKADRSKDCITQCSDSPSCIDRCREVTGQR